MPVLRVLVVVFILGATIARGGYDCAFAPTTGMRFIAPTCPYSNACAPGTSNEFRLVPSDGSILAGISPYTIDWCDKVTWDFGDGVTQTHYGRNTALHRYRANGNYTITVTVENAHGGAQMKHHMIISENMPPPGVLLPEVWWNRPKYTESNRIVFTPVSLHPPVDRVITVDYTVAGDVVRPKSGTVVFAAGATRAEIALELIDDDLYAYGPEVLVDLQNPTGGAGVYWSPFGNAVALVQDNEPFPRMTIDDVIAREEDGVANVLLRIDPPVAMSRNSVIAMWCRLSPKTAHPEADYRIVKSTVFFRHAARVVEFPVAIVDDDLAEAPETFEIECSSLTYSFSSLHGRATVTILSDEPYRRRAVRH